LVVLISGHGSNLQVLIDAELDAKIVLVVSNRHKAYGLKRAYKSNIPTLCSPYRKGHSREIYEADLAAQVASYWPDLIILAGWMHVLSSVFLDRFPDKVINLHPALPGQFPGTNAIERAYKAFKQGEISHTGVMVHWVVPKIDAGNVIVSERVPIYEDDKVTDLEMRTHHAEHRLIIEAVKRVLL